MTIVSTTPESAPRHAAPPPCVLLTGFDAFGAERLKQPPLNPSWLAVQALHGELVAGHRVVAAELPTVFATASDTLLALMDRYQPALVVCVGQAGGRSALSIERVAINLVDAAMADNAGAQPRNEPVLAGQSAAYFSTLPVVAMQQALHDAGMPAELSMSAGTFVCNHVFYRLMHALATEPGCASTRGGFIHVPFLPSQGVPNLPLASAVDGLRRALSCALTVPAPARARPVTDD
jgi:pyroglutamyl-peptidase